MAVNPPFEYAITPQRIEGGTRWVSVHLKNISRSPMMNMDVRLISTDPLRIRALDRGGYVNMLNPGEDRVVPVQVEVNQGSWVYLHVEYWQDDELMQWESPNVWIKVRRDPARIMTLFATNGPQVHLGEQIPVEATVTADLPVEGLRIEFWIETASGQFEAFYSAAVEPLDAGEVRTLSTAFSPEEIGLFSIYAYLFDGDHRLDRMIEQLRVAET